MNMAEGRGGGGGGGGGNAALVIQYSYSDLTRKGCFEI